jgi:hypothetical protein
MLLRFWLKISGLLVFLACSGLCNAAENASPKSDIGKPFATVWRLRGEVVATNKDGTARRLKSGETVLVGETVRAEPDSEAVLKTADAGIVAVRPGAKFVAEQFAAEGKTTDRQILRLITGSLRIITGWVGQINRQGHRVNTNTATMGIRGTDHEPYELPQAMANARYPAGTYDKVNRGSTQLDANGGSVVIEPGRVGFARDAKTPAPKARALMTLLLPVLLEKVPDFYLAGAFDQELDRYSESAQANSRKELEKLTGIKLPSVPEKAQKAETEAISSATDSSEALTEPSITGCPPEVIGQVWLNRLDRSIARKDVKTILGLFASDVIAKATVRSGDKLVTLEFSRSDMVSSTLNSVASLKNYQQRRVSFEASLAEGETTTSCKQIIVKSIAIEQGLMNGKPYRFEALEHYVLEQRDGQWLAVTAQTTQQ